MTQLGLEPTYLLDSCCVVNLDNKHRHPNVPPEFDDVERESIWNGLEALANDGFLKLIKQVKGELTDWHPSGLRRLAAFSGAKYALKRSERVVREYQRVVQAYPDLINKSKRDDPADPWLITVARLHGWHILTEEFPMSSRSLKATRELRIPDVCTREGIQCTNLRTLARSKGWLR